MAMRAGAASEHVRMLGELAQAQRLARIKYLKPGEVWPSSRLVEPYELQQAPDGLVVRCWQVDPPAEGEGWRSFRAERIEAVEDGGRGFAPRGAVTLGTAAASGALDGARAPAPLPPGPARAYYEHLHAALHDGKVTREEAARAQALGAALATGQRRAIHARVFAEVLAATLLDETIDEPEAIYVHNVRKFLEILGWGF